MTHDHPGDKGLDEPDGPIDLEADPTRREDTEADIDSTLTLPSGLTGTARQKFSVAGGRVGRYLIIEPIGHGGMGVVYKAYDPELDRRVAIKVLRKARSERARVRLQREAQAQARLSHRNVVAVHDVGEVDGSVFVAMEYLEGETLHHWQRQSRSLAEILEVYGAAGSGLQAAHRAGLVHRDFKPGNVIVGRDGRVCVLDFGLARAAELHSSHDEPIEEEVDQVETLLLSDGAGELRPAVSRCFIGCGARAQSVLDELGDHGAEAGILLCANADASLPCPRDLGPDPLGVALSAHDPPRFQRPENGPPRRVLSGRALGGSLGPAAGPGAR